VSVCMDVWHITHGEALLRLLVSAALGGIIGLEREFTRHPAGFRTHLLVCVGSTLIMLLSAYGFSDFANEANVRIDPARLGAQVISGIGFLGAGTIMRNGLTVSGLTTAASLWVAAAIGLTVGAGVYFIATVGTVIVLASLSPLSKLEAKLFRFNRNEALKVEMSDQVLNLAEVFSVCRELNIPIRRISLMSENESKNGLPRSAVLNYSSTDSSRREVLLKRIREIHGITRVEHM
jgi:putative Mg2+ transporter-C (MgtC) family protein